MLGSSSPRRFLVARTALVGIVATALAVGGFAGVAHADSVDWTVVTNESSLDTALTNGDQNIELGNSVTVDAEQLTISEGLTLNVAGYALTTQNITIAADSSLTVVDEDADGNILTTGSLSATGTTYYAGITVGHSSDGFTASDITLTAVGGYMAAGIGGDHGDPYSGPIEIDDSTLTATGGYDSAAVGSGNMGEVEGAIRINDTAITATAGSDSAVIGGGDGGQIFASTDLDISSLGKAVSLTGNAEAPVIGPGYGAGFNDSGEWDLQGNVTLDSPGYLDVPNDGGSYTLDGNLSGSGAITGSGTLDSSANIPWGSDQLSSNVTIEGYNYPVDFNAEGGTPADQSVTVHGTTFAGGGVDAPSTTPTIMGGIFKDWENAGTPFSTSTDITGISEFDAVYNPITALAAGTTSGSFDSGDTETFQSIGSDVESDTSDQSQWVVITSTDPSDQINGDQVTYGKQGTRTLTFTLPEDVTTPPYYTVQITTNPGPATQLELSPSASSVLVGGSLTFATSEEDAGGDQLGDVTNSTTLTSNIGADVVAGDKVTFASAGEHEITASENGLSGTYWVDVTPTATPDKLVIESDGTEVTAGNELYLEVFGVDSSDSPTGDYSSRVVWSGLNKTDVVDSDGITFTVAGLRTIKATVGKVSTSLKVEVVPAGLDHIAFVKPAASVVSGAPTTFTVDGYDVYGNDLGVDTGATVTIGSVLSGESVTGSSVTLVGLGLRSVSALDASAADLDGDYVTAAVNVVAGPVKQLTASTASDTVVAGSVVTFTVAGSDSESNALGDVTTKTKLTSSVSSDKIAKNVVTVSKAGTHTITFKDGSVSTSYALIVVPAESVTGKYVFEKPTTTAILNAPTSIQLDTADAYGNPVAAAHPVTYAVSGTDASVSQPDATVTATTAGKRAISATVGTTKLSETITFAKAPGIVQFSSANLTASVATASFPVSVSPAPDAPAPTGTVTLHFGSSHVSAPIVDNDTATPALPALEVGKYTFYATYSGDANYAAVTGKKVTVNVVAGELYSLKFIKPATTAVAGKATKFTVYGYDAHGNLIADETAFADLAIVGGADGLSSPVTFNQAGPVTLTASLGGAEVATALTVTTGPLFSFDPIASPSEPTAGQQFAFTATGTDAHANSVGDITSKLTIKSSVSSDAISKNKVTATKAGAHTYIIKDGSVTETVIIYVDPAAAAAGKYAFANPATTGYLNEPDDQAQNIGLVSLDKYGNVVQPVEDVTFLSSGQGDTISSLWQSVTFQSVGKRTISATTEDDVTLHETINVVKDAATISFDHEALLPDTPSTITVTVGAGKSGLLPSGTVQLHYGNVVIDPIAIDDENAQATFNLPALTGKSYVMYVTYSGDSTYAPKTSTKYTIATDGILFG